MAKGIKGKWITGGNGDMAWSPSAPKKPKAARPKKPKPVRAPKKAAMAKVLVTKEQPKRGTTKSKWVRPK